MATSEALQESTNDTISPQLSRPPPNRRRDKPQLSCTLCRRRKWKCDRQQPCETCVRRGLSLSCTYVHPKASDRLGTSQSVSSGPSNVPDRIAQLEKLVVSLMSGANVDKIIETSTNGVAAGLEAPLAVNGEETQPDSHTLDPAQLSDTFGRINLESTGASYVEGTHWSAILDGIAELKDYFEDEQRPDEPQIIEATYEGPELLVGRSKHASRQEILAGIPPRAVTDKLVIRCMNTYHFAQLLVHTPSFLKEYEKFWENPHETPIMFIGFLFSLMCSAAQEQQSIADNAEFSTVLQSTDHRYLIKVFLEKIVQCLILGKYMRPVQYTMETLIMYLFVEYGRTKDAQVENWLLLGLVIRLAVRMGYHRDGSHFPSISPYDAEMRRRVWAVLIQQDVIMSAQVGLPRIIGDKLADTKEPHNLLNEDFDVNDTELAPARSPTFPSHVQFLNGKNRITIIFGMISDLDTSAQPVPYSEVMRYDKLLIDAYASTPENLQVQPMSKSILDDPNLILGRVFIALVFYKAQCVLHRKYMLPAKTDARYAYSRKTCIAAALQLLEYQSNLFEETQPGGRFHTSGGKVKSDSSMIKQEYLLATTILCLDLNHDITSASTGEPQTNSQHDVTREEVVKALNRSYMIWLSTIDTSRESRKAAQVIKIVLGNAEKLKMRNSSSLGNAADHSCGDNSTMYALPLDAWSYATQLPTSQETSANVSIGSSPLPMNLSMDQTDMNALFAWPDVTAGAITTATWDTGLRMQSFDDWLTTFDVFSGTAMES